MSSRSSSITGKRECPDSTTTGRMRPGRIAAPHEHHLRARHHDVAHLEIPDLEHPFEHGERVGVEEAALAGFAQHGQQLLRSCGSLRDALREALEPASGGS